MKDQYAYHAGRTVGKYTLESLIGRGGMAEVYKSTHPELGRDLAIKILHPFHTDEPGFIERFRREAQAVAVLRHPNIIQVYDFAATEDGLYYMVMEYVQGVSLEEYLSQRQQPLSLSETAALLKQVASALHFAHQNQTIHRDIKPANIMVTADGHVYLADFGIAQLLGASRLTQSGVATGTPSFMAPEQIMGKAITMAVDIYALGVVLYQMLTKRLPFEGDNPATTMMRQATETPTPPSQFAPDIPLAIEEIILKALAKEPQERFSDALAMADALEQAVGDTRSTPLTTITPRPETTQDTVVPQTPANTIAATTPDTQLIPVSRTPAWVWLVVTIAALALVAVGFLLAGNNQATVGDPTTVFDPVIAVVEPTAVAPTETPSPTSTATPLPSPTPVPVIEGMTFIPAGQFSQGNDNGNSDEAPAHPVQLDGYFIATTEVRNADYYRFIAETGQAAPENWIQPDPSLWSVTASQPYFVGNVTNPFDYEGELVQPSHGTLSMTLDADNDTGLIVATFTGTIQVSNDESEIYSGSFRVEQDFFFDGPPFPAFKEGGIADFVVMHGLSGNELSLYPELESYIGTWGFADVYLDDTLLFEDLGIHVMYTDGVRDDRQHTIRRADMSCCFSESAPGDSYIDPDEQEISIWLFPANTTYDATNTFWMNIYYNEVTVLAAPEFSGPPIYPEERVDHPVTFVSWEDAFAYCHWRGARLPTEAEWEYAARGPDGLLYPWGNESRPSVANVANTFAGTTPVDGFPDSASPFGVLNMAGNVWEWTADWYNASYYARAAEKNPTGPVSGEMRVARGGGFRLLDFLGLDESRATHRRPLDAMTMSDDLGFRCALSLDTLPTEQESQKEGLLLARLLTLDVEMLNASPPSRLCHIPPPVTR